jgi:UDP-N-acetylglucosamine acyltransferase
MPSIHPTAVIEEGAQIGEGCRIGPHAVIYRHVTLGPGCDVHAGAVLGDTPQDFAFQESVESRVVIGAKTVIREHVTIHRGTKEGTSTVVGERCFLMANSHLGHNVVLGNDVILANGSMLGGYVEVGDRAFLSGNVLVHQFTRIGRLAMVSGGAGLSKDVPPFCTMHGAAVNQLAGLNVVGMRRAGMTPPQRAEVKRAFALLYRSGLNVKQALEKMRVEFADGPAAEVYTFVTSSKRGICALSGEGEESSSSSSS